MKMMVILLALTTMIISIIGCDENKAEIKSIDGEYSSVSSLEKNSKAEVKLDVFINFSCLHCYNSHKIM
ncbi:MULTISPECIES: hypothetical protein [unclassified Colwellia]|uniref:hypothetical protein n=1 Tax=unclassified Colwellia TaxID=196834 RepID=UPI0015F5BFBF|nr:MULTISPECIES: hypothetical protein [unclassified Colwellia]MBA6233195.1 hypothetical protein [Colwellia sp. MB02u-7]MBA6236285.1 hypothetical protein [Colwellia sp. MB02u-11]MBA6256823.1 hypothetical protein [Colwellia sp. MB3u-28]MBA6261171.1 hypothetical protein [Colwellia sp. MB3u-41]MBA6298315.1 hypothetical protein [Colwellia sp. MB3u-22]